MEVCLIGRRHSDVSRQGTPPSEECNLYLPRKNHQHTITPSLLCRKDMMRKVANLCFAVVYHAITDGSP
jgi:hypothetical protein